MTTNDLLQSVEDKKDYFLLTLKGLKPSTAYPVQLRWQKKDDSRGLWSASKVLDTPGESNVSVPSYPVVSTDPGIIAISWDGKDSLGNNLLNFNRVEVSVTDTNNTFASVDNIAGSFKSKGYLSIPVKAGVYQVQLRTVTALGTISSLTEPAQTVTVEGGIPIDPPTLPIGLTATSAPFGIAINWTGAYKDDAKFGGFKAINIYASTSDLGSSITTIASTKLVGTMVVDVTVNKITIGLESLKQALSLTVSTVYTTPIYLYYIATNQKDQQYSVNGTPTYTRLNSTGISPTKANIVDLANGLISIENLVAGNGQFTSWLRTGTPGGSRIELNGGNAFTDNGHSVLPGFTVYNSGSEPLFRATLDGTVTFGSYAPSDLDAISSDASTGKSNADLALLKGKNFDSDGNISKAIAIPSSSSPGSIYSVKNTYSRDDLTGWFLGWSGTHPVINIGSSDNYLKWTPDNTLEIKGQIKTYNSSGYIALGETAGQITFNSSGYTSPGYIKHSGSSGIGAIEIGSGSADGTGNPATMELWSYAGGSRAWITADSFINMQAYLFRVMSTSIIVDAFSWSYDDTKTYTNKLVTVAPGGTLSKSGIGLWVSGAYGTSAPANDIGQDGDLLFSS